MQPISISSCCVMHRVPSIFQVIWNMSFAFIVKTKIRNWFHSAFVCLGGMILVSTRTHSVTHNWCTLFPHRISFSICFPTFFLYLYHISFKCSTHTHIHTENGSSNYHEKHISKRAFAFLSLFYAHSFNWIWELSAHGTVYSPNINDNNDTNIVRKLV